MSYKCTPAPEDCSGWFRTNVSIAWTVLPSGATRTGCVSKTYTTDTAGTNEYCRADDGTAAVTVELRIRRDSRPPTVTGGQPSRAADADGWYNRPVGIAFSGSDLTSGVAGCTTPTYGGPDSAGASVIGTCTDNAGNTSSGLGYGLKYDATAPAITGATPERPANAAGWFNAPVRFGVQASDATSGLADCPPVAYSGPDSATASITGSCRDRAGNGSSRAFGLKYDATAPAVMDLKATPGNGSVSLSWRTAADAASVAVVRTPGVPPEPASVVFRGPGAKFADESAANGVRYTYEVRVQDAADNAGSDTVAATPTAAPAGGVAPVTAKSRRDRRILAPAAGARFTAAHPPLLQWTRVPRARYYNVQLFRDGRKILSVWPRRARYQLERSWTYRGKRRRLVPDEYAWVVWPGFGPRSRADYGKRIGRGRFEIVRAGEATRAVRTAAISR